MGAGRRSGIGRRPAILAGCLFVALVVVWYAGLQAPPPAPAPAAGSVRLGPEPGEDVAAYLARLPGELPPPGSRALALVQFSSELTVPDALAVTRGTTPATAVFRVPFDRVQTALRFIPLESGVTPATALDTARVRAWRAAETDAGGAGAAGSGTIPPGGRRAAVAAVEAAALADPGCRCVLAVLVDADRAGLEAVTGRPGVRAVHAAPPGVTAREIAPVPLLPGQVTRADPLPDDGPVPPL